MVTQENYLFSGTVADNIRFGRPDASIDEVVAAAHALGAARLHHATARRLRHRRRQLRRPALAPASASWSPSPAPSSPTRRC